MKKTAQDYLAEKLQDTELSLKIAYASYNYWRNKAMELMKSCGMSDQIIEEEFIKAGKEGYYF